MNENDRLIWIDLETTGLDENKNEILEVACVITDSELTELCVYETAIWQPGDLPGRCSPFIKKMHYKQHPSESTGYLQPALLDRVKTSELEASDVQKDLLKLFHFHGVQPLKGILSGSSIHFDRRFMAKHMPLLEAFFYHRMFDTSALKTAAQMWNPDLLPPPPKTHRALADIRASIGLARVFKPVFEQALGQTAPSASTADRIAEVARDFGEGQSTKSAVLRRRICEIVALAVIEKKS